MTATTPSKPDSAQGTVAWPAGIFGHHPDQSTDFCCEVEMLEGWAEDVKAGTRSQWPFWGRFSALLRYIRSDEFASLDDIAQRAKDIVLSLEGRLTAAPAPAASRPYPGDGEVWLTRGMRADGEWAEWSVVSSKMAQNWMRDASFKNGRRQVQMFRASLASDATANCCHCGRIVDTREKEQGGDDFGCQLTDGRWTCSPECWEAVVESDASANSKADEAMQNNLQEAWSALRMIREAVETLGPVGGIPSEEHVACAIAPTFMAEADAIVAGILKIANSKAGDEDARGALAKAVAEVEALQARVSELVRVEHQTFMDAAQINAAAGSDAARDILAERRRQVEVEGWTPEHDDEHRHGEMADAAALYASLRVRHLTGFATWPWDAKWFKPTVGNHRRDLVKAGALILAEIERIDRARTLATPETERR